MSKKPAKKKTGGAKAIRTSLRACYFRLTVGTLLLIVGSMMLLSVLTPEKQSLALDSVGATMHGLGGGSLGIFLPCWMILAGARLLTGMFHRVNSRGLIVIGAIWTLFLGFMTLITYVDKSSGQNVMDYYRNVLANGKAGIPGFGDYLRIAYDDGAKNLYLHGALGMMIAYPMWRFIGSLGGAVIIGVMILVLGMVLFSFKPWQMINSLSYWRAGHRREREIGEEPEAEEGEPDYPGNGEEAWGDPGYAPQDGNGGNDGRMPEGMYGPAGGDAGYRGAYPPAQPSGAYSSPYRACDGGAADEDGYYAVSGDSFYDEIAQSVSSGRGKRTAKPPVKAGVAPAQNNEQRDQAAPGGIPPWEREAAEDTVFPGERAPEAAENARPAGGRRTGAAENMPPAGGRRTGAPETEYTPGREAPSGFSNRAQDDASRTGTAARGRKQPAADRWRQDAALPDDGEAAGEADFEREEAPEPTRPAPSRKETPRKKENGTDAPASPRGSWLDQVRSREKRLKEEPADSQKTAQVTYGGAVPVTTDSVLDGDVHVSLRNGAAPRNGADTLDGMEKGRTSDLNIDTRSNVTYHFPQISLLKPGVDFNSVDHSHEDSQKARIIEETLKSFGIPSEVKRILHGPAITSFAIQIAPGILVQRVTRVADNLELNLATKHVRVQAPIQGTNYIGVEVPNRQISTVSLREVLESEQMRRNSSPLAVALGKDIAGMPVVCDLSRMPHLLIAGSTGSGKSVCIHSIVCSLLYRTPPQDVRLIMIDPKQVELTQYNGVPHLLIPVVTDMRKASGALAWVVQEMQDRYDMFKRDGIRNIEAYNRAHQADGEKLPNIVVIIDEMADLMDVARKDVEEYIRRLAALARAAGIYLVLATQRPSVDVITGVIKNNIPSRIAFAVTSGTDSRTILDSNGAETLMGKGDMLYKPTGASADRVQGCFVSDDEVAAVVQYIRDRHKSDYNQDIIEQLDKTGNGQGRDGGAETLPNGDDEGDNDGKPDPLLQEAIQMAIEDGQTSTSMLQRRLRVGYARAGRLVDEMEKRGVVSPWDGSKARKTLMTREQYNEMMAEDAGDS